eukprot:Lankesteria_metandrocarpae@DN4971_c0_g1_i1.p1
MDEEVKQQHKRGSGKSKKRKSSKIKKLETPIENPKFKSKDRTDVNGNRSSNVAEGLEAHIPRVVPFIGVARRWTVSLALPLSCVANAQSHILRAYLVGQFARCATLFCIDEVVVFDDTSTAGRDTAEAERWASFATINLTYLDTPQYLRKALFPYNADLKFAGLENPLDAPHHLRKQEWLPFREGVVKSCTGSCSVVDCGLEQAVVIDSALPLNTRVTLKMPRKELFTQGRAKARVVSPRSPQRTCGLYWGYTVRYEPSLSSLLGSKPFKAKRSDGSSSKAVPTGDEDSANVTEAIQNTAGTVTGKSGTTAQAVGYDLLVGTSDKGRMADDAEYTLADGQTFEHLLIVFGGVAGLEECVRLDPAFHERGIHTPQQLFSDYINICRHQGSRTMRTEEAMIATLTLLRPHILKNCTPASTTATTAS